MLKLTVESFSKKCLQLLTYDSEYPDNGLIIGNNYFNCLLQGQLIALFVLMECYIYEVLVDHKNGVVYYIVGLILFIIYKFLSIFV